MKALPNQRSGDSRKPQTENNRKKETEAFELRLTLDKSDMECRLTLVPKQGPCPFAPNELITALKELGVVSGINTDAIADCCKKITEGQPTQDILIARGAAPEKGIDASVEFLQKTPHKPVFTEDITGHIDFHETHLFDNVIAGYELALIHPSVRGKDGYTVTGKVIPPAPPRECPIRAGDGVEFRKDDNVFLATKDGYATIKSNLLQVRDEYTVEGDLDLHTGNLNFKGHVHVCGDVMDGFHIKATKDIRIDKNAGHCRFECGGNMEIGGMNGLGIEAETSAKRDVMPHPNTTGTILCRGNLTARYLHHVYVECEGNLHVTKEIMHSVIRCAGTVTVDGRIIGGNCTALAGIESLKVGTEMGIQTDLTAGEDYRETQHENSIAEALEQMHRKRENLMVEVGPGPFTPQHMQALPHNIQLRTMELLTVIHQLEEQSAELKARLVHRSSEAIRNPKINILREVHANTIIQLGETMQKIQDLVKGPVSIIEYRDELRILPMTPIAKLAVKLQEELREQERKETLAKAAQLGIKKPETMELTELIRAIQTAEGYQPCFCTPDCPVPNAECCWRKDCRQVPANVEST